MRFLLPMLFVTLLPASARADDLHAFFAAPQDGSGGPVLVHRPSDFLPGDWYATALLELVDREPFAGADDLLTDGALDALLTLDTVGGIAASRRLRFDVSLPLYLATFDDEAPGVGVPGDLQLAAEAVLARPERGLGYGLELVPYVVLPTGPEERLLGRAGPTAGGYATVSRTGTRLGFVAEAGLELGVVEPLPRPVRAGGAVTARLTRATTLVTEGRAELGVATVPRMEALLSIRQRARTGAHWVAGSGVRFLGLSEAPTWRLYAGAGFGARGRRDLDVDGLVAEDDRCPEESEVVNGYLDHDGCPDALADLVVVPIYAGAPYPEAAAVASDGWDTHAARPGPLTVPDRAPGERWEARAFQDCLTGAGEAELVPGTTRLFVDLVPSHDATLELVVRDGLGADVPDARLVWLAAEPAPCAAVREARVTDGRAIVPVGAGSHLVRVEAPGFVSQELQLWFRRGSHQSRHVVLDDEA